MHVKIFNTNENGKIEFTKKELEYLLNEIYDSAYANAKKEYPFWNTPINTGIKTNRDNDFITYL